MADVTRYVSVDYEQRKFNVGQALFPRNPQPNIITIASLEALPIASRGLGAGITAGIAVGAFVLLSILAALAWWVRRRRSKRRMEKDTDAARTTSVDETTLAGDQNEYFKPPQELVGEGLAGDGDHELDTSSGLHELEAGSVHFRPSHPRQNVSFGSSQSGISPMGIGDRVNGMFGEPSPPMELSSGSPSPPLSDRRHEQFGGSFPLFEVQ